MKKVKWRWDMGVYVPFCPYCDEFPYDDDKCVFCGKPYKWVDGSIKETVVTEGDYTIYQGTSNHIQLYKDGKLIVHMSCTKKMTEEELKEIIERYNNGN